VRAARKVPAVEHRERGLEAMIRAASRDALGALAGERLWSKRTWWKAPRSAGARLADRAADRVRSSGDQESELPGYGRQSARELPSLPGESPGNVAIYPTFEADT
jgi:hypothetical protein